MIPYQKGEKMKNKILTLILMITTVLTLSGCSDDVNTSTMTAHTSVYPVEFILDSLYGENIAIQGIYPDDINYKTYKLTDYQLSDISKSDLFVYSGIIPKEKDYAVKLINKNKKIKLIDASLGMSYTNDIAETWLNPSNYLMLASNIKTGLEEYISENIELKKIEKNYNSLKLNLTKIDAELKMIGSNSVNNTLIVSNDTFKFLEKYGFTIISLEQNENLSDKVIAEAKKLLANKKVHYIFLKDNEEESELIKELKNTYNVSTVSLNSLSTLKNEDRIERKDYISIMYENINSIKLEATQ